MLFGALNSGSVWGLDGGAVLSVGKRSINIGPEQVVCVLQLRGKCHLVVNGKPEMGLDGEGVLFIHGVENSTVEVVFPDTVSNPDVVLLGFGRSIIQQTLKSVQPGLNQGIQKLVFEPGRAPFSKIMRMPTLVRERVIPDFRNPPVSGAAVDFWFESRVREVIALCFFNDEAQQGQDFFCTRQKRIARERISQTKEFIQENLDQPFNLKATADVVGCSAHYLSRTFSETEGMTISQYLRRVRVERAAELLASGNYNVSEAAVEVGYQSLSHFSKAFQQEKGVLPSRWDFGR